MDDKKEIELFLDENNEIIFDILIEGNIKSSPKIRFICENKNYSLSFDGNKTDEGVKITIPKLDEIFSAGEYDSKLEVIVDDKYFVPMKLKTIFKKKVSVKTESFSIKRNEKLEIKSENIKINCSMAKKPAETKKEVKKINENELKDLIQKVLKN